MKGIQFNMDGYRKSIPFPGKPVCGSIEDLLAEPSG